MVLGICGVALPFLGIVLGPLGIIFAAAAWRDMRSMQQAGSDLNGNGFAVAGMVTGIIGLVFWALILTLVLVALGNAGGDPSYYYDEY